MDGMTYLGVALVQIFTHEAHLTDSFGFEREKLSNSCKNNIISSD
jgi:hypothetical protein